MNFDNSYTFEKTHTSSQHEGKSCILAFYIIQSTPNTNINKTHIKARKTQNSRQRKESPTSQKISNICVEQFCKVECKTSDDATVMSICFTNTAIFSLSYCEKKLFSSLYIFLHILFYTKFKSMVVQLFLSFMWGSKKFGLCAVRAVGFFRWKCSHKIHSSLLWCVAVQEHSIIFVNIFTVYSRRVSEFSYICSSWIYISDD
jgi:hypothetical protein